MDSKEEQYKELFISEALNGLEELNNLLTVLEKDIDDKQTVDAIFRITHTLKGNAVGIGFTDIGNLAHALEDIFEAFKYGKIKIRSNIFNDLFKAVDLLGALTDSLNSGKKVSYKGLQTKLQVFLKNNLEHSDTAVPSQEEPQVQKIEEKPKPRAKAKKTSVKQNVVKKEESLVQEEVSEKVKAPEEPEELVETAITFSDMVQIPVRKLDNLLNLVGELTIERDRLAAGQNVSNNEFSLLNRISSDLQYSVMDVRMVQVGFLFNKFIRIARDAANIESKKVNVKLEGVETEIDRNVLQVISDSLIHLVRNSIGHGIESPEERIKANKSEEGQIILRALNDKDSIIIEIKDDGKGIDTQVIKKRAVEKGLLTQRLAETLSEKELIMLIFEPGFSSAEKVNAISGRGVGMDVVKRAIDSIGGSIDLRTVKGEGTTISLHLPSSMTVKASLLLKLGKAEYAIPLVYTEAVLSIKPSQIKMMSNRRVTDYLGKTIVLISLHELLFKRKHELETLDENTKIQVVVVSYNNFMFGLLVDKLLQQKEIVEKPLQNPLDKVKAISGVTILGNGNVCLVLNIPVIASKTLNFFRAEENAENDKIKVG